MSYYNSYLYGNKTRLTSFECMHCRETFPVE